MTTIILLCFAGFIAAFVDSIAGGGGLISVPAFLIAGLSPHLTLGTNKFASTTGSLTSSIKFALSGKVNFKLIRFLVPFTLLGAALGVNTVLKIDQSFLKSLVLILILFVGVYSLFSKTLGAANKFNNPTPFSLVGGILLAFSLGFYDGFFGPGTGSFLIFGFDFLNASGNAKFLNFISNITSLALFAMKGNISYSYGIPVALFMILGANLGTKYALKKGTTLIKPIFITMSLGVAIKMLYDLL